MNRETLALTVVTLLTTSVIGGSPFPDFAQLPSRSAYPDPLVMLNGERVETPEQWVTRRRPELKALFEHYMYGRAPAAPAKLKFSIEHADKACFGGKASRKEVVISFGESASRKIHLLVVIPNAKPGPAPVFLGVNFCGNHTVLPDAAIALPEGWMPRNCPGCENNRATDAGRGKQVDTWAVEQSIDRGYAVATFYNGDLEPDRPEAEEGIRAWQKRQGASDAGARPDWGTIMAWAWGFHRAVDYLHTDPEIDTNRIAVVGHSRNGKTALLAAAFDERIDLAIPLQAGCGGTAPSRGKIGESVKQINDRFPHWFNDEFKRFNDQPERLPFDQHCLVALVAPRPVLFANALEDTWANPNGQFEMLQAADPVYRLLRAGGLEAKQPPELNKLVDSKLGYFIRPGKHSMTREDWSVFLDFADKHFGKPSRKK